MQHRARAALAVVAALLGAGEVRGARAAGRAATSACRRPGAARAPLTVRAISLITGCMARIYPASGSADPGKHYVCGVAAEADPRRRRWPAPRAELRWKRMAGRPGASAVVLFALAVVLFAPATLGSKILSGSDIPLFSAPYVPPPGAAPANGLQFDAANVFEPDGLQVRAALRHLRLPVWTGALSTGRPLLAEQQSAPLFPLTWLGVVFPYWDALAWIAVLKLTLAGLGTVLLARWLGLRPVAALVGGLAFGFGTYLVDWLSHPHANAYILLPWCLWLAGRLCRSGALRDAGALGGVLGLAWLGGQPESALLVSLATAAWAVQRLAAARAPRPELLRRVALLALAGLLGLGLGAVMLLPLLEALHVAPATSRASAPLPLRAAATLFFPELWGRPTGPQVVGPSNFAERTVYAGVLPLVLAVAGLAVRRPSGAQLFFAGLVVVSLAVSLDTGPIADAAKSAPVLDRVALTRAIVLAGFGIAMLAAFGLDRHPRRGARAEAPLPGRRRCRGGPAGAGRRRGPSGVARRPARWREPVPRPRDHGHSRDPGDGVGPALARARRGLLRPAGRGDPRAAVPVLLAAAARRGRARPARDGSRLQPRDHRGAGAAADARAGRGAPRGDGVGRAGRRHRRPRAQHRLAVGAGRRPRPRAADGETCVAPLVRARRQRERQHRGGRAAGSADGQAARHLRRARRAARAGVRAPLAADLRACPAARPHRPRRP